MRIATRFRHVPILAVALAVAVTPLANPLLLALAALAAGLLLVYRCVTDLLGTEHAIIGGDTVFRHYV